MLLLVINVFFILMTDVGTADSQVEDEVLVIVHSDDTPPLSFLGYDGEPKGLVIDYWRAWAKKNGKLVEFVQTDWPGTLAMIREGKADIHGGLYYNEERDAFLDYSEPYFDLNAAIFVRNSLNIQSIADLGKRPVAVLEKGFSEFYLRKNYPALVLKPYKTSRHMVDAAVSGEVDAMLTEFTTLVHQLGSRAKRDEFKSLKMLYSHSLRAAVAEGNEELLALVRKGQENMTAKELDRVFHHWAIIQPKFPSWGFPVIISSVVAAIVTLFFWTRRRPH